jgi:ricin-type beta-trefoil lectin protein/cellulase (glycosyl hydrolase family 5)
VAAPHAGYLNLVVAQSGQCLSVAGASLSAGAGLVQWPCNGGDNQEWLVSSFSGGLTLTARHSGLCLAVEGASTAEGARILQTSCITFPPPAWVASSSSLPSGAGSNLGFFVNSGKIFDGNGLPFVPEGANLVYWCGFGFNVDGISSRWAFNTVRLNFYVQDTTPANVDAVMGDYLRNKLAVILGTHHRTCGQCNDLTALEETADFFIAAKDVIAKYKRYVFLNLMNEFGHYISYPQNWQTAPPSAEQVPFDYAQEYSRLIVKMRAGGLTGMPIVVDCLGASAESLLEYQQNWRKILDADPEKNVIFSCHYYDDPMQDEMDQAAAQGIPFLVGEESSYHSGAKLQAIKTRARQYGQGFLLWDIGCDGLNIADAAGNPLGSTLQPLFTGTTKATHF